MNDQKHEVLYGIDADMNLVMEHPATVADVRIRYNGESKQFTYAEFLKACGFGGNIHGNTFAAEPGPTAIKLQDGEESNRD